MPPTIAAPARRLIGSLRWRRQRALRLASRTAFRADLALLRRTTPLSDNFGFERGVPIDRRYIATFLERHAGSPGYAAGAIQGHVLEIGERTYADRFGTPSDVPAPGYVHRVDVLHGNAANAGATIVGSLTDPATVPGDTFDCIICTQTLHVIYDVRAALATLHHALAPGGTLLATVPGITRSCLPDRDNWGDYWRFTQQSARRLAEEVFDPRNVEVQSHGNVLTASAFLYGLAADELPREHFELDDPDFELLVTIRATK